MKPRPLVVAAFALTAAGAACAAAPRGGGSGAPPKPPPSSEGSSPGAAAASAPEPAPCRDDAGCGYDPASDTCGTDPRYNRQPPLVDQGIVCYCEERGACAMLRALPVPCEGDADCAVRAAPRPHPVRASAEEPHEKGRPCRDFTIATTCERTNICTMRRLACP